AQYAQAVDHGGVGVGADYGVGIGAQHAVFLTREDDAGQILDVDLVDNAGARRYDAEVGEGILAPAQEGVAFLVALEFDGGVLGHRVRGAEVVDHDRVVNDQVGRGERIDALGVAAQAGHGVAHGGQVDHCRYTGEVLHDDPRRGKGDFSAGLGLGVPVEQRLDVLLGDVLAVLGTEQVFQQHLERVREAIDVVFLSQGVEVENLVVLAVDIECRTGAKASAHRASHSVLSG